MVVVKAVVLIEKERRLCVVIVNDTYITGMNCAKLHATFSDGPNIDK